MSTAKSPKREGREFFYIDDDGQKNDIDIHGPILDGISPEADLAQRLETFHRVVGRGTLSAEAAARLYGLTPEDIMREAPRKA